MKKEQIEILERQGCFSTDWSKVEIDDGTDFSRIRNVYFSGPVKIGKGTEIINVPGGISNVRIGDDVKIVNVARIENSSNTTFGIGTDIAVLDETGGRPVRMYPGISAQVAFLAARMPEYARELLRPMIDKHIQTITESLAEKPEIGDGAEIRDCGPITDIRIWPGVKIEGAARLKNGCIVNNQELRVKGDVSSTEPLSYVGQGVDAENFIIEDGIVSGGCMLRNTYVGQGSMLDKGFTSHDSLFFANCTMENGEACSVLAGPYTVSVHKSSLLIGCQTAFMNAGSGTNMSNHMYKLGPMHWGVLERGVKTSSNAYLMHGSRIGAFSLVMGEHKSHPDTSEFPFSYLFGDKDGKTIVVPGAMLQSYGLKRDAEKWPRRDRRLNHALKLNDRITYSILNPYAVNIILDSLRLIQLLLNTPMDKDGFVEYNGLKIKRSSLEKGKRLYELAICKYLQLLNDKESSKSSKQTTDSSGRWIDLLGQIISESDLKTTLNARSIPEIEDTLDKATGYPIRSSLLKNADITQGADEFDAMVEKDRIDSLARISRENDMMSKL